MKAGAGDVMLDEEDDHDTLAPFLVGFAFPNVIKHLYVTKINIHSVGTQTTCMWFASTVEHSHTFDHRTLPLY